MDSTSMNRCLAVPAKDGGFKLRIFQRKATKNKLARLLVKCGCCDERLEIYYDRTTLEINGVIASIAEWKALLLPLLEEGSKKP